MQCSTLTDCISFYSQLVKLVLASILNNVQLLIRKCIITNTKYVSINSQKNTEIYTIGSAHVRLSASLRLNANPIFFSKWLKRLPPPCTTCVHIPLLKYLLTMLVKDVFIMFPHSLRWKYRQNLTFSAPTAMIGVYDVTEMCAGTCSSKYRWRHSLSAQVGPGSEVKIFILFQFVEDSDQILK
jgi:hypothetical protein